MIEVPGEGGGLAAIGIGRDDKIAAVTKLNSIVFIYPGGECYETPIPHAKPWASRMFAGPRTGPLLWFRPGIVPGSSLFAIPYGDRGTLPVFDVTVRPPKLIHVLDVAGISLSHVVSLVAGRRVFVKKNDSFEIQAWDFSDGVKLLWKKVFPGIDNRDQAFLGYYKGNVVVPGKAVIYFIDENTGMVNYRFCVPAALERYAEYLKKPPPGAPPYIRSYAFLGQYLIASSRNRREPLYVWKIPEKLIPVKPHPSPARKDKKAEGK